MSKIVKLKKKCAVVNCSNPKCPFPHATETDVANMKSKPGVEKKKSMLEELARLIHVIM